MLGCSNGCLRVWPARVSIRIAAQPLLPSSCALACIGYGWACAGVVLWLVLVSFEKWHVHLGGDVRIVGPSPSYRT